MKARQALSALALVGQALGHGYVYRITADNTVYPGWDVRLDRGQSPAPARIAFGGGDVGPVTDANSPDIACNRGHSPAPGAIAEVRAGSDITFHWSHWLYSHKGPITAWMAPYEGDIADVDVNELEFFKFAEDTIADDGRWGTVRMMDDTDGAWTATVPADIKPGKYVVRQEGFPIGPQFYMTCFNIEVTGDGEATPQGATFPGAYDMEAPGLNFDLNSTDPYPAVGPALYESEYAVDLEPLESVIVSPTGEGEEADEEYYAAQSIAEDVVIRDEKMPGV
ncbi:unnamed protein product [Parascedosporium putredinis]|uniref:lytic cellulose monooxygenase (C4-dehydrogenating) n=1 Tax=Parascedosporium putredinis TaxID=1442378 RepID=A0A9P1HDH9_9PEZI|nr:unnamed protein product [Parascedosporium putredinis]CAI8004298.1 unnamed protein product [Parascedosporium putredinis]